MKNIPIISLILCCLHVHQISTAGEDYYWREYTGSIPADAYVAGTAVNGQNVYIGQAYVNGRGNIVVQINPGKDEVIAPIYGTNVTTKGIKIFCTGDVNDLKWISINEGHLQVQLIGKHAVIGGLEGDKVLHVGRISREGSIKIGKVLSWAEPTIMYYVFDDKEAATKTFEILIYEKSTPDIDIREGN